MTSNWGVSAFLGAMAVLFCPGFISMEAYALPKPDLTIRLLGCPDGVEPGQAVGDMLDVRVSQLVQGVATKVSVDIVLTSQKRYPTPPPFARYSKTYFDGVLLKGGREVLKIATERNRRVDLRGSNEIPSDTPPGVYYFAVVVDPGDRVEESNEDNNVAFCRVRVRPKAKVSEWPTGYHYLGNYPSDRENGWSNELQGVTHDHSHWYFTQRDRLWKFPVGHDLSAYVGGPDPVLGILATDIPRPLQDDGYDHFGDLDYHRGLLLVPTEGKEAGRHGRPPIIAVFMASDLSYLGHLQLPHQDQAGWCAVRPADGRIYSSNSLLNRDSGILAYSVNWDLVARGQLPVSPSRMNPYGLAAVRLSPESEILLRDEKGSPMTMSTMQGGVFSVHDEFYTVNGYSKGSTAHTGIMGFNPVTGRRQVHSTNGYGSFNFEFHPGDWVNREEPEGITLWDLDGGQAPGIRGQMHVIMIDNFPDSHGPDDLYFKHYRLSYGGVRPPVGKICSSRQKCCEPAEQEGRCDLCWPQSKPCP